MSLLPQDIQAPHLLEWWLIGARFRLTKSHISLIIGSCDITWQKLKSYIFTSTRPISIKLGTVVTLGEGKVIWPLIMWLQDVTWQIYLNATQRFISTSTRILNTKLDSVVTLAEELPLTKPHLSLLALVASSDGLSLTKSNAPLIMSPSDITGQNKNVISQNR